MTVVCLFNLALAAAILPVVQEQHQLLVTLLLCNAAAMEVRPYINSFNNLCLERCSLTILLLDECLIEVLQMEQVSLWSAIVDAS